MPGPRALTLTTCETHEALGSDRRGADRAECAARRAEMRVHGRTAPLRGSFTPPGDKSIAHRAAIVAALSTGECVISGFPNGQDCASTLRCLQALGVGVRREEDGSVIVSGRGRSGLSEPEDVLDAGNSGTTARLLSGALAGQAGVFVLTGDRSLRRRPMGRIVEPLRAMDADVTGRCGGSFLPLVIRGAGARRLRARRHALKVASAQVKSCILLAGLFADGVTVVVEPSASRDHTERLLRFVGIQVDVDARSDPTRGGGEVEVSLAGGQAPRPFRLRVPGDPSSAAFALGAAAMLPGSRVTASGVCANPTRLGFLKVFADMGADVAIEPVEENACEPIANIHVGHADLEGIDVSPALVPFMIDEIPLLAVVACSAKSPSTFRGVAELRVKETDRLAAIVEELSKMGARIAQDGDSLRVHPSDLRGARVSARGDHRMAMALTVAGLAAEGETVIEDYDCVAISYPAFAEDMASLQGRD